MLYLLEKTWAVVKKPKNILDSWGTLINIPINYLFAAAQRGVTISLTSISIASSSVGCLYKILTKNRELRNERNGLKALELQLSTSSENVATTAKFISIGAGLTMLPALLMYCIGMYQEIPLALNVFFAGVSIAMFPLCTKIFNSISRDQIDEYRKIVESASVELIVDKILAVPKTVENLTASVWSRIFSQRWKQDEQLRSTNKALIILGERLRALRQDRQELQEKTVLPMDELKRLVIEKTQDMELLIELQKPQELLQLGSELAKASPGTEQTIMQLILVLLRFQQYCQKSQEEMGLKSLDLKSRSEGIPQQIEEQERKLQLLQQLGKKTQGDTDIYSSIELALKKLEAHIEELVEELQLLQRNGQELQTKMVKVSSDLELEETMVQINLEQTAIKRLRSFGSNFEGIQQRAIELSEKLSEVNSDLEIARKQIESLRELKIDGLVFSLTGIETEIERLTIGLQESQQEANLLGEEIRGTVDNLQKAQQQIGYFVEELQVLQTGVEKSQEEIRDMDGSLEQAKMKVDNLEQELASLSQKQSANKDSRSGSGLRTGSCLFSQSLADGDLGGLEQAPQLPPLS